jgi:2-iminoacetate synthase ThiH
MNNSVAEMTLDELRQLVRSVVKEVLAETLADPDAGLELREEVIEHLNDVMARLRESALETTKIEDVAAELGLQW